LVKLAGATRASALCSAKITREFASISTKEVALIFGTGGKIDLAFTGSAKVKSADKVTSKYLNNAEASNPSGIDQLLINELP
jgi:hypothetical protein